MPQVISLEIDGGWNTDAAPSAPFIRKANGAVSVPWLIDAENIVYHLDGWPRKMPGASNVNTTATGATDAVMGIYDYWRSGTGTPTQKRVIYAGASIYKDDADGVWDSLKAGLETGKMPAFETMNDNLIMATDSTVDVPQSYNQTAISDLGGTPPNFDFHVEHKQRMFAAGAASNKSRLYYTVLGNEANWTGAGSGSIDVAPDDGDVITALASHQDELLIWKGPNKGSLYRLIGSSPTGAEAFALVPLVKGVGATSHQSLLKLAGDLLWWDHNGVHSLSATARFGDYAPTFHSAPISRFFLDDLNHTRFRQVGGLYNSTSGYALWTCSQNGQTTHNTVLGLDTRFQPWRWFRWPARAVAALAMVLDSSVQTPWMGTYTGFVRRLNRTSRTDAGTAYLYRVTLPFLSFGDAFFDKHLLNGRLAYVPTSTAAATIGWQRDGQAQQTATITMTGSPLLGPADDPFLLDEDVLGGERSTQGFIQMTGQFKEVQLQLLQGTADADLEPHELALIIEDDGLGMTAIPG